MENEFINTFNTHYPFERYIFKNPVQVNSLFDDLVVVELFIPSTEIKPVFDDEGRLYTFTRIPTDEIYVKLRNKNCQGTFRLAYFDLSESIREDIEYYMVRDFGDYAWECLYVQFDDNSLNDLREALQIQKTLIENSYGICNIKPSCITEDTINLIKELK